MNFVDIHKNPLSGGSNEYPQHIGCGVTKPVFGVSDKTRRKPVSHV